MSGVSRAYLRDLLFRRPGRVLPALRAHRGLRAWSAAATVRALADTRSYRRWLTAAAGALGEPMPSHHTPQLSWGGAVRLPPWTTRVTAAHAAALLRRAVAATTATAASRAQHRAVTMVRATARTVRQHSRVMARAGGVALAAPYLDDQVVAAALAVDLAARGDPWRYKPLLSAALAPVVPPELTGRRTKAMFSAEGIAGMRRHRATLVEFCDDLALARLGLVDPVALRRACVGLDPTGQTLMAVENTVAVELWLRAALGARRGPGHSR